MGLFDNIEKLINERGAANILRERLLMAADKYSVLERKITELESAISVRDTEITKLESENQRLEFDINNLRQEIQKRDELIQEETTRDNLLDDSKLKILLFLSIQQFPVQSYHIEQHMRLPIQLTLFHIEELRTKTNLIVSSHSFEGVPLFALSQEGRRYLIDHNLL